MLKYILVKHSDLVCFTLLIIRNCKLLNKTKIIIEALFFFFNMISMQNDDIETDINKLRPRQLPIRPFDELRPFERFFPEFSEDFQVRIFL